MRWRFPFLHLRTSQQAALARHVLGYAFSRARWRKLAPTPGNGGSSGTFSFSEVSAFALKPVGKRTAVAPVFALRLGAPTAIGFSDSPALVVNLEPRAVASGDGRTTLFRRAEVPCSWKDSFFDEKRLLAGSVASPQNVGTGT
ncbi:uncharacterized protein TEOVI_000395400 [Trypanosoma equiperdum]|uniref:Uncharacterized protein n=1 Tax=Trypanosoma equiperdum TaxID=5694 RepID=A0A1G4IJ81_TRYEQ|nr:hypothetical protein TEOVI_000395400 [Trypanosoma equiperdum]